MTIIDLTKMEFLFNTKLFYSVTRKALEEKEIERTEIEHLKTVYNSLITYLENAFSYTESSVFPSMLESNDSRPEKERGREGRGKTEAVPKKLKL